jgi:hypothetical protein
VVLSFVLVWGGWLFKLNGASWFYPCILHTSVKLFKLMSRPFGLVVIWRILAVLCLARNLSMRSIGGALDLRGKQKANCAAALTMVRYAMYQL